MKIFGDLSQPETYDFLSSKSKISANKKTYLGNPSDYVLVFATWASYIVFSLYFLLVISPYFWVDFSPAITIIGIFLSLPGLYNAVKCFLTEPGILKRDTFIKPEIGDPELKQNIELQFQQNEQQNILKQEELPLPQMSNSNQKSEIKVVPDKSDSPPKIQGQQGLEIKADQFPEPEKTKVEDHLNMNNIEKPIDFENQAGLKAYPDKPFKPVTGDLFSERYCHTCRLKRPPLASHCSHCNNCVKEFDHHCFFMGNCIGERNQLNFFLFLFFSSIMVIYYTILSIISFVDNISPNAFVFEEFYNNQPLFIVFVSIMGAGSIIHLFDGCDKQKDYMKFLMVIMIGFSFFWIAITNDVIYYRNPVIPLVGFLIYIQFVFVLFPRMLQYGFLACIGSTLKQQAYKEKHKISQDSKFTCGQGAHHFWQFISKTNPESEILLS